MTPEDQKLADQVRFLRTRMAAEALFDVVTVLNRIYVRESPLLKTLTDVSTKPSTAEPWAEAHPLINQNVIQAMYSVMSLQGDDKPFLKPAQPLRTIVRDAALKVVNCATEVQTKVSAKAVRLGQMTAYVGRLTGYLFQVFNPCLSTWEDKQSLDVEYRMLMDLTSSGGIFLGFRMTSNPNAISSNLWWERPISQFTTNDPTGNEPSVMKRLEGLELHEMYDDYLEGTGIRSTPSRFNTWYNALCNSISELLAGVFLRAF